MSLANLIAAFKTTFGLLGKTGDEQATNLANDIMGNLEAADFGAADDNHTHEGVEENSLVLGAGASIGEPGATALGANAHANHSGATALGIGAITTADAQVRLGISESHVSIPGKVYCAGDISLKASASVNGAGTFRSADGTAGMTGVISWSDSTWTHIVTIKNGLITNWVAYET